MIDGNGEGVCFKLNSDIAYSHGSIEKLKEDDKYSYYVNTERIKERGMVDTAFYKIAVECYPPRRSEKNSKVLTFIINSSLKVIASFEDENLFGVEYDGYKDCEVKTEREFYFTDEEREYMIFSRRLVVTRYDDNKFTEEHLWGIDQQAYDDLMRDFDPDFDAYEGDYVAVQDIFYDNPKDCIFTEYYRTLYGIIDCKISSAKQLLPFTDSQSYVCNILRKRKENEEELSRWRIYGEGWDYDNKRFYGSVLTNRFLEYPPRICGLTINCLSRYYPKTLIKAVEEGMILIPNKFLDNLGNNEITRKIRIEQECHLEYSKIFSTDDVVRSNEKYGIVSSYQGKNIKQVVYSKGGVKHLVQLLRDSDFEIEKEVISELLLNASNEIEERCYGILLSTIVDIEVREEEYEVWCQQQIDDYINREANREFDGMMDDMDAWGNID